LEISVISVGFVRLVNASTLASKGYNVIVPDADAGKVDLLTRGNPL